MTNTTAPATTTTNTSTQSNAGVNAGASTSQGSSSSPSHLPLFSPGSAFHPVDAVALQLPEFMSYDADLWFHTIEAKFRLKGITAEQTKFDYVLGALPASVSLNIKHLIRNPGNTPYSSVRNALARHYQTNPVSQLLDFYQSPSAASPNLNSVLAKFRAIAPSPEQNEMAAVLLQTPEPIRAHLVSQLKNFTTADDLCDAAAPLMANSAAPVNAVASFKTTNKRNFAGHSSASASTSGSKWCMYHQRFKDKARKCIKPCSFRSNRHVNVALDNSSEDQGNFQALH